MQIKKNVVASLDGCPVVVDLADFPHGDLSSVRRDKDYDIEFYDVPDGVMVPAYDENSGTVKMRQVKYWSIHRGKAVEIVNLDDGRQIITDNDPRAVYGVPSEADSLKPGRFRPSEAMDRGVLVPVVNDELASDMEGMFYCFTDGIIGPEKKDASVEIGFDFGQFVGIMAGDGWASSGRQTWLSDNEGFNKEFALGFLRKLFPEMSCVSYESKADECPRRYGDTVAHRFNMGFMGFADRIRELVDGHGDETTSGSANKRLPVWYQFAGRDFILGLVNGMIATDGAVCVTHGKKKPQLQISFSSTSLRLAREFKRCCQLIGVRSSITFSKKTSGGNTSWICSVSTIDAKRSGLLERCCHERKRGVFLSTGVEVSDRNVKNDIIPFPKGVAERIVKLVPSAKTHGVDLDSLGEDEKARRMRYQAVAVNVRQHAKLGFITRGLVRAIRSLGDEIAGRNEKMFSCGMAVLTEIRGRLNVKSEGAVATDARRCQVSAEEADALSRMVSSVRPRYRESWTSDARPVSLSISQVRKRGYMTRSQVSGIIGFFEKYGAPNSELRDSADMKDLCSVAEADVTWLRIASVEKTGKVETGYDLTVPGPDTFVSDDGIVLSNTVNIHVPASMKAARQALDKMLPSKNLFSLTDMKSVRYKPEKEQISGLWALTRGATRKPARRFASKADAIAAYRNGEIGPNDPVEIGG